MKQKKWWIYLIALAFFGISLGLYINPIISYATKIISDYAALTPMASNDLFLVEDVDAVAYKKVTLVGLMAAPGPIGGTTPGAGAFTTIAASGTVTATGIVSVGTSLNPDIADGATLGTAALEISDLYLATGGIIYGENDQANTLTSSATGWTANLNLAATTYGSDGSITDAELLTVDDNRNAVNLLTNSGFGVWSNSEDLYTTAGTVPASGDGYTHDTETCDDDAVDDESVDWSETGAGSIAYDVNIYDFDGSAANEYIHSAADFAALTAGKLYEMQIYFADEAAAQTVQMGVFTTGAAAFTAIGPDITTAGGGATYNRVFEADGTERRIGFKVTSNPGGANLINWKDTLLHEVTPGIVSDGTEGPDGWLTSITGTGANVYREHNGSNTTGSNFYSLKIVSTGNSNYEVYGPINFAKSEHKVSFTNRTVTFGAWIKTDAASQVKLIITEDSDNSSSLNTGSGWEWLKVTHMFDSTPANVIFGFYVVDTKTAYISSPMLVFGSSIGQGNYVQPPGEQILFEASETLTDYSAVTAADATILLEAQSEGKVPKGVTTVFVEALGTGNAATDIVDFYESSSKALRWLTLNVDGTNPWTRQGWVGTDANGDIYIDDTGSMGTFTIKVLGIQVN